MRTCWAGLSGPWRFTVPVVGLFGAGHREGRRMRIRRDIPTGYGVEARESFWIRAPKAAVLRSKFLIGSSSAAPFRLVKSGRDHSWDAASRGGVVSSRFSPELADTRPHLVCGRFRADTSKARALVETWLILPVVICLSQRLSHACLSISFYMAKLRMAH